MTAGGVQHRQAEGAVACCTLFRQGQAHAWCSLSLKDERGQIPKLPVVGHAAVFVDVKTDFEGEASVLAEPQVFVKRRKHGVGGDGQSCGLGVDTCPCGPCGDGLDGDFDGSCVTRIQREAGSCACRLKSIAAVHGPSVFQGGVLTKERGQAWPRNFKLNFVIGTQHVRNVQREFSHRGHGHRKRQRRTRAHQRFPRHVVVRGQGKFDVRGVKAVDCRERGGGGGGPFSIERQSVVGPRIRQVRALWDIRGFDFLSFASGCKFSCGVLGDPDVHKPFEPVARAPGIVNRVDLHGDCACGLFRRKVQRQRHGSTAGKLLVISSKCRCP